MGVLTWSSDLPPAIQSSCHSRDKLCCYFPRCDLMELRSALPCSSDSTCDIVWMAALTAPSHTEADPGPVRSRAGFSCVIIFLTAYQSLLWQGTMLKLGTGGLNFWSWPTKWRFLAADILYSRTSQKPLITVNRSKDGAVNGTGSKQQPGAPADGRTLG